MMKRAVINIIFEHLFVSPTEIRTHQAKKLFIQKKDINELKRKGIFYSFSKAPVWQWIRPKSLYHKSYESWKKKPSSTKTMMNI